MASNVPAEDEHAPRADARDAPAHITRASRAGRVLGLLEELEERGGVASRGRYDALAVLLTDAILSTDETALLAGQDGLQRVHAAQLHVAEPTPANFEQRGRVLTALEFVTWTLRRLTPAALTAQLERGGYTRRFLEAIERDPGLSNNELAELLDVDETEISRVGRRLRDAGLADKHRTGRRNEWRITPRGRHALGASGRSASKRPTPVCVA
jgi:DNA-binding transcriptional ArsR family regulator